MLSQLFGTFSRDKDTAPIVGLPDQQPDVARRSGITFLVDEVTPAEKLIWTETLEKSLSRRLGRKLLVLPQSETPVANAIADSYGEKSLQYVGTLFGGPCHPLIDAVHTAFSQHRPLAISPDGIWLVIAQGFGHHVSENEATMRERLVAHRGRRTLDVKVEKLELGNFSEAIASFSSQIREAIDPLLHETLVCSFSTTTPAIRTASEVALMDSFSSYFDYSLICVCGIPKVTLEGTVEDWQQIRARIEVFEKYGLGWWVSRLRPILDQFILTSTGNPSLEFWRAIYKPEKAYGSDVATGWITDLFPYLGDAPKRCRSHVFEHDRNHWALSTAHGVTTKSPFSTAWSRIGVGLESFPSGLSSVPVTILLPHGMTCKVDMIAGFLAVKQNPSELTLSPVISWSVAERDPQNPPAAATPLTMPTPIT